MAFGMLIGISFSVEAAESAVSGLAMGEIGTIAGNGMLDFSGDGGSATAAGILPYSIAVDSIGNIYMAEQRERDTHQLTIS